jgi:hypothetical protein
MDYRIDYPTLLSRWSLQRACHVKLPHCFNHEDITIPEWKARLERQWRYVARTKHALFYPWQRLMSSVDLQAWIQRDS